MTGCMYRLYCKGEPGIPQRAISLVREITFKQIVKMLSKASKKHCNNTGTICLNVILRTWDRFLHNVLTELHVFFHDWKHNIF